MERNINPVTNINEVIENFEQIAEWEPLRVAGNVVLCERMEYETYLTLRDQSGDIQIHLSRSYIGEKAYSRLMLVDIGDILCIDGARHMSHDGEITVKADRMRILARGCSALSA